MIIHLLQESARLSFGEIASRCKLSDSTVHYRIDRLMKMGVIEGFTTKLNLQRLGYNLEVTMGMTVQPRYIEYVSEQLSRIPQFYSIWIVSGAHNISCRGAFKSQLELNKALQSLHKLKGVKEYHLSVLSQRVKDVFQIPDSP